MGMKIKATPTIKDYARKFDDWARKGSSKQKKREAFDKTTLGKYVKTRKHDMDTYEEQTKREAAKAQENISNKVVGIKEEITKRAEEIEKQGGVPEAKIPRPDEKAKEDIPIKAI